jgi:hypothetical protein
MLSYDLKSMKMQIRAVAAAWGESMPRGRRMHADETGQVSSISVGISG